MNLQTYDHEIVGGVSGLIRNREGDGQWVKTSEAEDEIAAKDAEIARLRKALEFIASSIPTGNGYSHAYLAKKTLEVGK